MLLSSRADIRVFGGGAGGGKSFAILLDPLRFHANPAVDWVSFRRTRPQLVQPGGLWDTSRKLYSSLGAIARESPSLDWRFSGGMKHKFAQLQHEKDMYAWQGAQVTGQNWDEGTHFTRAQFWYLQSRIRSAAGVRGHTNITCNPDPDWWGLELIGWWIGEDGYPIPERSGKLRYFIRSEDDFVWADTKEELIERYPKDGRFAKSVTFIPSMLEDNRILMEGDPEYEATLNAMCYVDRMRLRGGNWKIRPAAGNMFREEWFSVVDAPPASAMRIRYWDRAGTAEPGKQDGETQSGDPDYTVGVRLALAPSGIFYVEHVTRLRGTPGEVERAIKNIAAQDGQNVAIGIEQDPGQAGKAEAGYHIKNLAGYDARAYPVAGKGKKVVRAKPASAQVEAGNVRLVRGSWNKDFLEELKNFPGKMHDDQVDAFSGALNALCEMNSNTPMAG